MKFGAGRDYEILRWERLRNSEVGDITKFGVGRDYEGAQHSAGDRRREVPVERHCLHVCINIYIYKYIYIFLCVYTYVYIYIYIYIDTCICIYMYMYM